MFTRTLPYVGILGVIFALPILAGAHMASPQNWNELETGPGMMRYIEDQQLGDELHEEMEELMVKMMSGSLTEAESNRLIELMDEYPGPYAMMMNRFDNGFNSSGYSGYGGHMMGWGYNGSGFGSSNIFSSIVFLIWTVAGILLLIWLWQQVFRKNSPTSGP